MVNFDQAYSEYYNLLYCDKDYQSETEYVDKLIKCRGKADSRKVLDIGCGTGRHAKALAAKNYFVYGIDRSKEMISQAEKTVEDGENLSFKVASAEDFSFDFKFDAVVSLFHVMSYLTDNSTLFQCFNNVYDALDNGGVFIFDFWYGPAVYAQKCTNRIKTLENDNFRILRFAEPVEDTQCNKVTVKYNMVCLDKRNNSALNFQEEHPMRYFFLPELQFMLEKSGFRDIHFEEFLSGNAPSVNTWGVCCTVRK